MNESSRPAHNPWVSVAIVCLAQLMVVLDATVVNVALPSIQHGLHLSQDNLQWVVNAYTLTFGGFLLLGGRLADLFGRRRLFFIGVSLFTAASLVNGLASSSAMLVASRAAQGIGAALVSPATLAIVNTTFPEGDDQRKALSLWAALSAGGAAVGLLLGGVLTQALSWPWIFFVNVPIGVGAVALAFRYVPGGRGEVAQRGTDVFGALSITGGLALLIYVIVETTTYGWGSARTLGLGALAIALIAAFVVIESRVRAPLVRLGIFRVRALAVGDGAMFFLGAGLFANFFFGTLYLQEILHFSPIATGFGFLPVAVLIGVAAGISQWLVPRLGVRTVAIIGMAIAAGGLALMVRIATDGTYAGTVLPPYILLAVGLGLAFVPATLISVSSVHGDDAGLASGLFNTAQQVGGALGLAVLVTVATSRTTSLLSGLGHHPSAHAVASASVSGYRIAFIIAAGFMIAAIAVLVTFLRAHHLKDVKIEGAELPAVLEA
ncbi:MAG TPA: MFS transporter [Solirubrobacteraceae bacterium]|nr:MFS transporter [Solirubrobacteraceae bacterium]